MTYPLPLASKRFETYSPSLNFRTDGGAYPLPSLRWWAYMRRSLFQKENWPAFTYLKNAEGAGGTTCAACAIVPVLGHLPTGGKAGDDDEMRKLITSTIREGQTVLFLDNVRGRIDSTSLERLTSSPTWKDRLLGGNKLVAAPNNVTVFVTGNNLTNTSDWRRRSLFIELHLSAERAEDKVFNRPLSVPV